LSFFEQEGHQVINSAPLIPRNDPSLMFTNAGMVPFKSVFTGLENRSYVRAVSSQKCVRAGGKHNDLDNVGHTGRHHTFFEMMGNFSFGDYFKERAIELAWKLVHGEWAIPVDRMVVTVYHEDEEAAVLWKKIAGFGDDRIIRITTNDNFWAMGDIGPCGPCSEIFYDHGPDVAGGPPGSDDEDGDRWVEIWNLVFMQYEQIDSETRVDLPKPSIDTGMGLERVAALMQGKANNYDSDLFQTIIHAVEEETQVAARGEKAVSHRVIADHLRASVFLMADGVFPSNEGRGYVLRRIMRRAMRHAHILGCADPLMHRLVTSLVTLMGSAYPELVRSEAMIREMLHQEEVRFRRTLTNGLKLLEEARGGLNQGDILAGDIAFKLYDTYGFPYDLTEDALRQQGIGVDRSGFDKAMAKQKAAARSAWVGSGESATSSLWYDLKEEFGATEFVGYDMNTAQGMVVAIIKDGARVDHAKTGDQVTVVVNQTPFYGESGGQVGDSGIITGDGDLKIPIDDCMKPLGALIAHRGRIESGRIAPGDTVKLSIDSDRRTTIRSNHSATHLLHEALRRQLGDHVTQKGSLVADDRLRFDVAHPKAITDDELCAVESDVNAHIRSNNNVETRLMAADDAIASGARALFDEKYEDEVRVLTMGGGVDDPYSVELCGGTHVAQLGEIGLFKILSEGAVSAGVRRIEALTGEAARRYLLDQESRVKTLSQLLKVGPQELVERTEQLLQNHKKLEKELSTAKQKSSLGEHPVERIGDIPFQFRIVEEISVKDLRTLVVKANASVNGVVVILSHGEGKASLVTHVHKAVADRVSAVDLVAVAGPALGGGKGGGRADLAQTGGPDASQEAAQKAKEAMTALIAG